MSASPHSVSTDEVRRAIIELIPDGTRVVAAVSGGADSLALLRLLRECEREIVVAHIDHGLRSAQSTADADFVAQLCRTLGVAFEVRRVEITVNAQVSSEMACRQARYAALLEIARAKNCTRVATGHTASDQLETILLHWLRGAAVSGLAGMPASRPFHDDLAAPAVLLVRPLLSLTRDETEHLCRDIGWQWRCDESNFDARFARNRVRHELIPLLENLMNAPNARSRLARQSHRAATIHHDDLHLLENLARAEVENLTIGRANDLRILDGLRFGDLPPALQRRVLRASAGDLDGGAISSRKIETARLHIVMNRRRAVWQWTRNLSVEWTGDAAGNRIRFRVVRPIRNDGDEESDGAS